MHECNVMQLLKTKEKNTKIKIFNQIVLKAETLNTFCIKINELLILDGHNKITHNIMYQV